jgi:hypothetical protein
LLFPGQRIGSHGRVFQRMESRSLRVSGHVESAQQRGGTRFDQCRFSCLESGRLRPEWNFRAENRLQC